MQTLFITSWKHAHHPQLKKWHINEFCKKDFAISSNSLNYTVSSLMQISSCRHRETYLQVLSKDFQIKRKIALIVHVNNMSWMPAVLLGLHHHISGWQAVGSACDLLFYVTALPIPPRHSSVSTPPPPHVSSSAFSVNRDYRAIFANKHCRVNLASQ